MRIAITGSIGSGKTVACEYLRQKGFDVFDCDKVNAELLKKGNAGYKEVKKEFPECFIEDELDKKLLSEIVFNDREKKEKLEAIMHPLILERMMQIDDDPFFAEVPLLFEVNWDRYFDVNILIATDMDLVMERLKERGLDEDEALRRLKNQMSVEEKVKRADKIIYNNGSLAQLYQAIEKTLEEVLC